MRPAGDFTVQRCPHEPWVTVWDPLGYQDIGCDTFLSFWAWQEVSPRRLRHWARQLAEIWTWLRITGYEWPTATPEVWRQWATCQLAASMKEGAIATRIETLYRYYGFWHWYDPHTVRQQPWPRDRHERARCLALLAHP